MTRVGPGWSPSMVRGRILDAEGRLRSVSRALGALGLADDAARVVAMCEALHGLHGSMRPMAMSHGAAIGNRRRREREAQLTACREAADRMERAVCAVLG